jgi:WXG100 family type VII secretion target
MSNNIIQADYDILETIAGRFAQQSEVSQTMHDAVRRSMQALQNGGWEGEGASAFFTEMEGDVFPAVTRLTGALSEAQRVTLQVKGILEAAEVEAARPFQSAQEPRIILADTSIVQPKFVFASEELNTSNGQVLGAETTTETASWRSNLQKEKEINQKIVDLKNGLPDDSTIADIDGRLTTIDEDIQKLEQERQALQNEADKWSNQLIPDWPLEWDSEDGVPWRVRTDDIEDEIAGYDSQIEALKEERQQLESQKQDLEKLNQLYGERETIRQNIENDMKRYDGSGYADGVDSTYGKPGQHPVDAPINSDANTRDSRLYDTTINQFGVDSNPRYKQDNYTYCNTFAGDVARSMDVPLPKKSEFGMNPNDPATIGFPQMWRYFTDPNAPVTAAEDGWRQVNANDLGTLQQHVNSGKMAVVVNNGHIAVVRPDQTITDFNDIRIAQAGATNSNDMAHIGSEVKPGISRERRQSRVTAFKL